MDLSFGISPCPNDVWIFSGLILGRVPTEGLSLQFRFADVETLNEASRLGDLDVLKISYAAYAGCEVSYERLRSGGALGRGVGPLLLRNGPGFDPEGEILSPGAATTANLLLTFYLGRPGHRRFVPFDDLYERLLVTPGEQGVVIHEKRFTYARDGLTLVQDLGDFWERRTGCPIPLGVIVARRSLNIAERMDGLIRASLQWAEANEAEALDLCREHAADMSDEVMRAHIDLYVNGFSHDLGEEGEAAVQRFLEVQKLLTDPQHA